MHCLLRTLSVCMHCVFAQWVLEQSSKVLSNKYISIIQIQKNLHSECIGLAFCILYTVWFEIFLFYAKLHYSRIHKTRSAGYYCSTIHLKVRCTNSIQYLCIVHHQKGLLKQVPWMRGTEEGRLVFGCCDVWCCVPRDWDGYESAAVLSFSPHHPSCRF